MIKRRVRASRFSVGEEVNPEFHCLRLSIVSIDHKTDTIEAVVIKAQGIYAVAHKDPTSGYSREGFTLGMELLFKPDELSGNGWIPRDNSDHSRVLPDFYLKISRRGEKLFVHQ